MTVASQKKIFISKRKKIRVSMKIETNTRIIFKLIELLIEWPVSFEYFLELGIRNFQPNRKVSKVSGSKVRLTNHKEVFVMAQAKTVPMISGLLYTWKCLKK